MNYTAEIVAKYVIQSDYTDIFATKVEMNSSITQTAEEINLEVSKKVGEDEIISKINQTAESITIDANRININGTVSANGNFRVDTNGNMECNNGTFNGGEISLSGGNLSQPKFEINSETGSRKSVITPYLIQTYLTNMTGKSINLQLGTEENSTSASNIYCGHDINNYVSITADSGGGRGVWHSVSNTTQVAAWGITTPNVTQTSLEETKKNISKVEENALEIVKNAEIYNYNLKSEKDTDKKHYGFIIGEKYKTPDQVVANSGEGIDIYSMCSILWKAVQEQQKEIEELKEGK